MTPEFKMFLEATDLDDLMSARESFSNPNTEDTQYLIEIVQKWENQQAVANILMYPELIPEDIRLSYLKKGLQENNVTYFRLAAMVGLSRIDIVTLPNNEQSDVVEKVIALMKDDPGVIAERASVFLADNMLYFHKNYAAEVVVFLDHPSDLVKHNTLVMLLSVVGLKNIRKLLDTATESNKLSRAGRLATEKKLSSISDNASHLNLGSLGASLLPYIPNLVDYTSD